MKKKFLFLFFIFLPIFLFGFEPLPKICVGETEVSLGMTKTEIISNFGEPDSVIIDVVSINDEYSSIKIDYFNKGLIFYYNKGNEKVHTISAKQNFFIFLKNDEIITRDTSIKDLMQFFPDVNKLSSSSYTISFDDKESSIRTDDIYFYFGLDGKLKQINITNDYY